MCLQADMQVGEEVDHVKEVLSGWLQAPQRLKYPNDMMDVYEIWTDVHFDIPWLVK